MLLLRVHIHVLILMMKDRNSRDKAIKFSSQAIRSATYGKGDEPVEGVDLTDLPEETGVSWTCCLDLCY